METGHNDSRQTFCDKCQKEFKCPSKFDRHFREVHQKLKKFLCNECPATFSRREHLSKHIFNAHMDSKFQCHICSEYISTGNNEIKRHLEVVHGKKPNQDHCSGGSVSRDEGCIICVSYMRTLHKTGFHLFDHRMTVKGENWIPRYIDASSTKNEEPKRSHPANLSHKKTQIASQNEIQTDSSSQVESPCLRSPENGVDFNSESLLVKQSHNDRFTGNQQIPNAPPQSSHDPSKRVHWDLPQSPSSMSSFPHQMHLPLSLLSPYNSHFAPSSPFGLGPFQQSGLSPWALGLLHGQANQNPKNLQVLLEQLSILKANLSSAMANHLNQQKPQA